MKPSRPIEAIANRVRTADHDGTMCWLQYRYNALAPQPSSTASTMTTPPSVGVPRLTWCDCGPSCRMYWP